MTKVPQMINSEQPRLSVQMVNNSKKIPFPNSFKNIQPNSKKYEVNPSKSHKSEVLPKQPSHSKWGSTGARVGGGAKRKRAEDSISIKSNYKPKNTRKRIKEEKVNKISNYFSKTVGESSGQLGSGLLKGQREIVCCPLLSAIQSSEQEHVSCLKVLLTE